MSVGRLANFFGGADFRGSSAHSIERSSVGQEIFAVLGLDQRGRLLAIVDDQRLGLGRTATASPGFSSAP